MHSDSASSGLPISFFDFDLPSEIDFGINVHIRR